MQTMRTTLHHIVRVNVPNLLTKIQNNRQQLSLNGLTITRWKSHQLLSANSKATATIDSMDIELEDEQLLLDVTINSNLTFENLFNSIWKNASQKLNALARITSYMNIQKRRTIMKSFVTSQFSYCPLIWMFHSRRLNNKINSTQERVLRITYKDNTSTFQELLNKDNYISIHQKLARFGNGNV